MPETASIKSLALSVLARKPSPIAALQKCPKPVIDAGHLRGQPTAPCGSPFCAGCYGVGEGRKIHPPKCGEEYRKWLERWEAKGKVQ
jgi:hypothetical protein